MLGVSSVKDSGFGSAEKKAERAPQCTGLTTALHRVISSVLSMADELTPAKWQPKGRDSHCCPPLHVRKLRHGDCERVQGPPV